ncbi:phosphatase and actin regulator 2 [Trichonephila clavipes]|nr:phosphatase and actin regulator 2 [Trichonephila clavipes]
MSETEKQRNSPSVTYTSSSVLETYNTVVVTNSGFPTVLSSSQNHAMPVIHNVSLLNLPDVEEEFSHDGEIVFSVLPEPPISGQVGRCGIGCGVVIQLNLSTKQSTQSSRAGAADPK